MLNKIREPAKKIRLNLKIKIKQKHNLEDFSQIIDKMLRTKYSKNAFDLIQRLTILHPTHRDGGIFNCFVDSE